MNVHFRRKCEVVLAVAKLTTQLVGCGTWLYTNQQMCLYDVLGVCYGVARQLLRCSGCFLSCC